MNTAKKTLALVLAAGSLAAQAPKAAAEELLSGPYTFGTQTSVHVKPAMLAGGWGLTLGAAMDFVINSTVTAGFEVDKDIPVVPVPESPNETIDLWFGGLRLGAVLGSDNLIHGLFNNTVGVGLVRDQTFLIDEISADAELNITNGIRVFSGLGWRYTYGINPDRGLSDSNVRGLFFDLGLRYGN